jgi:hypothetical protein
VCGPGEKLVLQRSDGGFELPPPGASWLSDPIVVNAITAAVVSTSHVLVSTTGLVHAGKAFRPDGLSGPGSAEGCQQQESPPPPLTVVVHAAFYCHVTDPVLLLEEGWAEDIRPLLSQQLLDDDQLVADLATGKGTGGSLEQLTAQVLARGKLLPPSAHGMDIELTAGSVGVHLSTQSCPRCPDGTWAGGWPLPHDGDPGSCDITWDEDWEEEQS